MALTNKEKMARRQERINRDPEARKKYLEKDRKRKQKQREKQKKAMSKREIKEHKAKETIRVKKWYHKKKTLANNTEPIVSAPEIEDSPPYRSPQSFGKAVKKVESTLPFSPRKRKAVMETLANRCGLSVSKEPRKSTWPPRGLSQESLQLINDFYTNNDISWQAPGRKDRVIFREKDPKTGKIKYEMQSRYMLMSLSEAHQMFLEKHPTVSVKLAKFSELRPRHCKLFDKIPHTVCVCSYHENVKLLLKALKEYTPDLQSDFRPFIDQLVCDSDSQKCMALQCENCMNKIHTYRPDEQNCNKPIKYIQWQKEQGLNQRVEKVEITSTVGAVFDELVSQLKAFLIHTFIKRKQASAFADMKTGVNGKKVVLQLDFSENASLFAQNEIQSAHWHHSQATVFTGYAWIDKDVCESLVIVSDYLDHNKQSVYKFLDYLIGYLTKKYPEIESIDAFSDGASSQFKQRFLFSNLHLLEMNHDIKLAWNFTATSHGKGVVDGIGGTIKRSVWRYVRSEQTNVTTPEKFAEVAAQRNPHVHIKYITASEIEENNLFLENHWKDVIAIPNTHSVHRVVPLDIKYVNAYEFSSSTSVRKVHINNFDSDSESEIDINECSDPIEDENNVKNVAVNDWVVVQYDGVAFPGEVTAISGNGDVEVNVMHKATTGMCYKWPNTPDKIMYEPRNIIKKINPPAVAGARGQFTFGTIF